MDRIRPLHCLRVAIFDCDGVILDSNAGKTDAFRLVLDGEDPDLIERFIVYHRANGGVSRLLKAQHFYRNMKGNADWEARAVVLSERFAAKSREIMLGSAEIPGVRVLLDNLAALRTPCFVVSGADTAEVKDVLHARGLGRYFAGIMGGPTSKRVHLGQLESAGKLPRPGVFFGDARADYLCAEHYRLDFVFISGFSEWSDGASVVARTGGASFTDFESYLQAP